MLCCAVPVQGASEVLFALGQDKLENVVDQLLPLSNHPKSGPREGLLWLFAFLPTTMGERFATLIDVALPVVLKVCQFGCQFSCGIVMLQASIIMCRVWRTTWSLCVTLRCGQALRL